MTEEPTYTRPKHSDDTRIPAPTEADLRHIQELCPWLDVAWFTDKCKVFLYHLEAHNRHTNLVGKNEFPHIWQRHIVDSLLPATTLRADTDAVADMGSGGGFPGIILALAGVRNLVLYESNGKKANFLTSCVSLLNIDAMVRNYRIESTDAKYTHITVRAVSSVEGCLRTLINGGFSGVRLYMYKGQRYTTEVQAAQKHFHFKWHWQSSPTGFGGILTIDI